MPIHKPLSLIAVAQPMNVIWRFSLVAALVIAGQPMIGCSSGLLAEAPESRLPRWFSQPKGGLTRDSFTVTMTLYVLPGGQSATVKLWDANGRKVAQITA